MVVLVIPARFVPGVLREAAEKGAGGAIVISGGFRESGREDLEEALQETVAATGLRIVGPNCQGVNYRPNKLCASWPLVKETGSLAVISQSGTVAATIAGWSVDEGLGISATVSLGNQVDVCESDLIEFFADDAESRVIVVYLEGARDGRRLLDVAERVVPRKPIVVLKSGRSEGGQRAAASHTSSMAGSDEVFDAACRQFGIIRVGDIESLYDTAKALAMLDLDGGDRLGVVTSSGGCGILAVDEAERGGLRVEALTARTVAALQEAELPPNAILSNPLDLTVCPAEDYGKAVRVLHREQPANNYLLIFGDPIPGATEVAEGMRTLVGARILVAYLGGGEVEKVERVRMHAAGIPVFATPQRAVRALAGGVRWKRLMNVRAG